MFQIVDGDYVLEDVGPYHSYGLVTPFGLRIEDITIDYDALREFVNALNCYRASELHILDMVLDFIG